MSKQKSPSNFIALRKFHHHIKGWLYESFGGSTIIDACAGSLHDLSNYQKAMCHHVIAIELDKHQCKKGLNAINKCRTASSTYVQVLQADLSTSLNESVKDELDHHPHVDAVFCNFALHYFWQSQEATNTFLDNIIPYLDDGGRMVVTFLQGDIIHQKGSVKIYSDDGILEFEMQAVNQEVAKVYVASIGIPHMESIIIRTELEKRFKDAGLELRLWLPFDTLRKMYSEELSKEEIEMSSMYAAAVFEKVDMKCVKPSHEYKGMSLDQSLFSYNMLPSELESQIVGFLSIPDLVKCRLLSSVWRREIDSLDINGKVKDNYFDNYWDEKYIKYNDGKFLFDSFHFEIRRYNLTLQSVGLYMRMGGHVEIQDHTFEEDQVWFDDNYSDDEFSYYSY